MLSHVKWSRFYQCSGSLHSAAGRVSKSTARNVNDDGSYDHGSYDHGSNGGGTSDSGFALVVVLWLLALLAFGSSLLTNAVRSHIRAAAQFDAATRGRLLAESAIGMVVLDLQHMTSDPGKESRLGQQEAPHVCAFGTDGRVAIRVRDSGGRIDINLAPQPLLEALMSGLGADAGVAHNVAAAIEARRASWMTNPSEQRTAVQPPLRLFESEDAIRQIDGMTPTLADAMMPYITVHSGIRGLDPKAVEPALASILQGDTSGGDVTGAVDLPSAFVGASTRQTFIVSVGARAPNGTVYAMSAVLRLARDAKFPTGVEVKSWHQDRAALRLVPSDVGDVPSCLAAGG